MAARKKKTEVINTENNILLEQENNTMKKELEEYVNEKVNKVFVEELDKANRRLLREKNRKIIFKNIAIIILLAIIGFLVYLLYTNNYFDRYFNKENNNNIIEKEKEKELEEKKEEVKKEPTLDELKKEYAHLLDNYILNDKSEYLDDFYNGNLTSNLKKYITLNTIDFSSIKTEDDYQIFSNDAFRLAYEKLFDNNYDATNFEYNGNKIRYVSMMNSYMTTSVLSKGNAVDREILNIKVNDDSILITTIEGVVRDSKLYNVLTDTEVIGYDETSLLKYSDSLNKITYVFKNNKLVDLVK